MNKNITFKSLGLSNEVLDAINEKGFEEPTAIQAATIPEMLKNDRDIIAQAETGTGKTAAFGLPLMDLLKPETHCVQALVLAPTRELAVQVAEEINSFKTKKGFKIVPVYGGQSFPQQLKRLKAGAHIIAGTPGRIIDHLKRKTLKLDKITHLVLDEADEMLNMGFIEEVEEIMSYTGSSKRTLLFSATMPERIKKLASKYMKESKHLKTTGEQLVTGLTEQIFFEVKACDKFEALCRIIDFEEDFYGLIFCRTRNDVDSLAIKLENRGYGVGGIHGDISQGAREKALKKFREQRISILAATDVAARGIDVSNLTHVINYSLPQDPEAYVHRIGRTGRAGKQGTAITFITPGEYKKLMFIQRSAKTNIKKSKIPEIKDIIQAKKRKITEELSNITQGEISQEFYKLAKTLIAENNPTEILAALLNHSFQNELNPDSYAEINEPRKGKPVDEKGKARLFAALGKKDGITPARLLQLIAEKTGIKKSQVRDIQIMKKFSFMNVSFEDAEKIIAAFRDEGGKPLFTHAQKDKAAKKKHRGK